MRQGQVADHDRLFRIGDYGSSERLRNTSLCHSRVVQQDPLGVPGSSAGVTDRSDLIRSRRSDLDVSLERLLGTPDLEVGEFPQLDSDSFCPGLEDGSFFGHQVVHADDDSQRLALGCDLEKSRDMVRRGKDDTQGGVIDDIFDNVGSKGVVKRNTNQRESMSSKIDQLPFGSVHAPDSHSESGLLVDEFRSTGGSGTLRTKTTIGFKSHDGSADVESSFRGGQVGHPCQSGREDDGRGRGRDGQDRPPTEQILSRITSSGYNG